MDFNQLFSQFAQKARDAYFGIENKYYALLDALDKKAPVYKIVDPIDKVFPSLLLWPILFIVAVLLLVFLFALPSTTILKVLSADQNTAVAGASVLVSFNGTDLQLTTDELGIATVQLGASEREASVIVEKTNYKKFSSTLILKASEITEIRLLLPPPPAIKKRIIIVDAETQEKITETASLSFSCSNQVNPPESAQTSNAELEIEFAQACGIVYASVSASNYAKRTNQPLNEELTYIKLTAENPNGKINVSVEDAVGNTLGEVNLLLLDADGMETDKATTDNAGTATFSEVKPGTYTITALHSDGRNAKEEIVLSAGQTLSPTIILKDLLTGKKIFIIIVDSETKEPINEAEITVFADQAKLEDAQTGLDGSYEKPMDETKAYSLVILHSSYLLKAIPVFSLKNQSDETPEAIELEKAKADNSNFGIISVNVTDYDSKKSVSDASVLLYDFDYNWMILSTIQTNSDGNVLFQNLVAASYFAKAKKADSDGKSGAVSLGLGETKNLEISMVLQTGFFEVTVLDYNSGLPVADANIAFFDAANGTKLDEQKTDIAGKAKSKPIKSDKTVFFTAAKQGFLSYNSIARKTIPNDTQKLEARLMDMRSAEKEKDIAIKFKGFYTDAALTKRETILKSGKDGKKYFLKFEIVLPKTTAYSELKKNARAGSSQKTILSDANYNVKILDDSAGQENSIVMSSCFNPQNLFENPVDCASTEKGAKQSNIFWQKPKSASIIEETLTAFIEPNLLAGTEIRFNYKASANIGSADFETVDYSLLYKIGEPSCEPNCPAFLWMFGLQENDSEIEQLDNFSQTNEKQLKVNSEYNLFYTVISTKENDYSAILSVENKNPQGIISFPPNDTNNEPIEISSFSLGGMSESSAGSPLKMRAIEEARFTQLSFDLETEPRERDSNTTLFFAVFADGNLLAINLPANLDPKVPGQIVSGKIVDANSQAVIANAIFKVFKDNNKQPIGTGYTDANGNFSYTIANAATNSVTLLFEKKGFRTKKETIPVIFTSYNPNFGCIATQTQALQLALTQTGDLNIITTNCNEEIEIMLVTELKTSTVKFGLGKTDNATIKITADKKNDFAAAINAGEYPVFIKARFLSDARFVNVSTFTVNIENPNSCFAISKTTFSFANSETDNATITNYCQTNMKSIFRPVLEMDSQQASLEYDPYSIPETVSFNWRAKAKATGKNFKYLGDTEEDRWTPYAIETGAIGKTFSKIVKTTLSDAGKTKIIRFEVLYPEACVEPGQLAVIAATTITINTPSGNTQLNVPCTATTTTAAASCTWEENVCYKTVDECEGIFSKCQRAYFDIQLSVDTNILYIQAYIFNPENNSSPSYTLFGTKKAWGITQSEPNTMEKNGLWHNATIETKERIQYVGKLNDEDKAVAEIEKLPDFATGFVLDQNYWIENNSGGEIETWLQGKDVFAKYIGKPTEPGNTIDFLLRNISVETTEYTNITVQAYTSEVK